MPNATRRANAQTLPEHDPVNDDAPPDGRLAFERAYAAWLHAKARSEDPDEPEDDGQRNALDDVTRKTERNFFLTPSVQPWMVWRKIEVFETLIVHEVSGNNRADSFPLLAWGAIKTDMINLNLCGCVL